MKKIGLVLLIGFLIFGCEKEKTKDNINDVLRITIPKDVGELNPHLMTSPHYAQSWVYEGLVTLKNGEIVPMLCEKWELTPDGKEYTFYLKKDVKFSDGTKFNSKIVKKNFENVLQNKNGFAFLQSLKEIKKIEIIDEYKIKFILNNPCNSFLNDLTFSRPLVFLGDNGFFNGEISAKKISKPIGTGMWCLNEHKQNQYTFFKRNENYWGDKPHFSSLKTYVVGDIITSIAMLKAGEIDMIYDNFDSLSISNIEELKKEGFNIKISDPMQVTSLSLNTNGKILKDKEVRKALSYATNKEEISKEIFKNIRKPANGYFTDDVQYIKNIKQKSYEFNIKKANKILDSAGWKYNGDIYREKNGQKLELKISLDNRIYNGKIIAEVLQEQYKKIGLKLNISIEESKLFRQNWTKGDFDIILFNSWGGSYEPFATLAAMSTLGDKFNVVQNGIKNRDKLHNIMLETLKTNDKNKLQNYFNYITDTFYEEAIYIPLVTTVIIVVANPNLEDIEFSSIKELIPLQNIKRK